MQMYILGGVRIFVCLATIIAHTIIMIRSKRKIIRCLSMILAALTCWFSEEITIVILTVLAMLIIGTFWVIFAGIILLMFGSIIFSIIISPIVALVRKIFH
jgi:hypothetical protein